MDNSYSDIVASGPVTEEENADLLARGLLLEDSKGELFDVSTDISGGSSFLNQSAQHSLILFEENEKLYYCETRNANSPSVATLNLSGPNSPVRNKSELRVELPVVNPPVNDESIDLLDEDEDKENRMVAATDLMEAPFTPSKNDNRLSTKLSDLGSSSKIGANSPNVSTGKVDKAVEKSRYDEFLTVVSPIAEDSYNEIPLDDSMDSVNVVPCTQNLSMNLNECDITGESTTDDFNVIPSTQNFSMDEGNVTGQSTSEDFNIVPCTQQQEESTAEDSQLDISSVPCSQASGTSREDLDDTITYMTKLLALADEQEAQEKMGLTLDKEAADNNVASTSADHISTSEGELGKNPSAPNSAAKPKDPPNPDDVLFKTPLKHARVKLLKGKSLFTPSPPRTHVDELLQRGHMMKNAVIMNKKALKIASKENSPANTSTPKRTPLNNITPARKPGPATPKHRTPVAAKVDSGLRNPFPVGLSPVANYIYSKPAPSTFARVTGIPNPNTKPFNNNAPFRSSSVSKIPAPPFSRPSQVKSTTPGSTTNTPPNGSSSKDKRHSVLKTSTYFNMSCTPPKIVMNEKSDSKKFKTLQYTGPTKVKTFNGRVETPPGDAYLAHRHIGLRDESGNASYIQNTFVEKRNIPAQSRLVTPQSYARTGNAM